MLILNVNDAREGARKRLPKVLFDYLDGSASDEMTSMENASDFAKLQFRQRVLVDVATRSLECELLGKHVSAPIVLGPVGFAGAFRFNGEILAARAAHELGLPYCLSMFSICSISQLRRATDGQLWMQLYITKDRRISESISEAARKNGVDTLVITVDTPAGAYRERDVRTGMRGANGLTPNILKSLMTRPGWCLNMMPGGIPKFGNLETSPHLGRYAFDQASGLAAEIDPSLDWNALRRIRDGWSGKLVLKGILDPEDARQATEVGVDAVVVSNHGGRQLDYVPSTISVLPSIISAVEGKAQVLLDSGVRRGTDVLKAMALGASGVLVGRPYAYALAADGQAGVKNLLRGWLAELDSALAHVGQPHLRQVSNTNVQRRVDMPRFNETNDPL